MNEKIIEKFSETEMKVIVPQPDKEEIVKLTDFKQRLTNKMADKDYLIQSCAERSAELDQEIALLTADIATAEGLGVKDEMEK